MLLYDKDDPLAVLELLAPDIRSVHVKDANRRRGWGTWGEEVPLGRGRRTRRRSCKALKRVGYRGPLCIERCVPNQQQAIHDITAGIMVLQDAVAKLRR